MECLLPRFRSNQPRPHPGRFVLLRCDQKQIRWGENASLNRAKILGQDGVDDIHIRRSVKPVHRLRARPIGAGSDSVRATKKELELQYGGVVGDADGTSKLDAEQCTGTYYVMRSEGTQTLRLVGERGSIRPR